MKKISRKGYIIQKSLLDENQTNQLVSDLTAKPKMVQGFGPNQKPIEYPIFLESKRSYYVPRFYGLSHLGQPEINNLDKGNDISIQFKGSLRNEQIPIQQLFIDQDKRMDWGRWNYFFKMWGWKNSISFIHY